MLKSGYYFWYNSICFESAYWTTWINKTLFAISFRLNEKKKKEKSYVQIGFQEKFVYNLFQIPQRLNEFDSRHSGKNIKYIPSLNSRDQIWNWYMLLAPKTS